MATTYCAPHRALCLTVLLPAPHHPGPQTGSFTNPPQHAAPAQRVPRSHGEASSSSSVLLELHITVPHAGHFSLQTPSSYSLPGEIFENQGNRGSQSPSVATSMGSQWSAQRAPAESFRSGSQSQAILRPQLSHTAISASHISRGRPSGVPTPSASWAVQPTRQSLPLRSDGPVAPMINLVEVYCVLDVHRGTRAGVSLETRGHALVTDPRICELEMLVDKSGEIIRIAEGTYGAGIVVADVLGAIWNGAGGSRRCKECGGKRCMCAKMRALIGALRVVGWKWRASEE